MNVGRSMGYIYTMKRTVSILLVLLYLVTCLGFFMAVRVGVVRAAAAEKIVKDKDLVAMNGIVRF
jgi:hypothetical protein